MNTAISVLLALSQDIRSGKIKTTEEMLDTIEKYVINLRRIQQINKKDIIEKLNQAPDY